MTGGEDSARRGPCQTPRRAREPASARRSEELAPGHAMSAEEDRQHHERGQQVARQDGPPRQRLEEPFRQRVTIARKNTSKQQKSMTKPNRIRGSRSARARRPAASQPKRTNATTWTTVYCSAPVHVITSAPGSRRP